MAGTGKILSVIVPLLDEAENIPTLHARLDAVGAGLGRGLELVFVDDGSTDASFDRLAEIARRDARVRVVRLSRNFGSHGACLAGFQSSTGDHVAILAADLQNPPELLARLLAEAEQGYDVVWAARRQGSRGLDTIPAALYYRLLRRTFPNLPPGGVDFMLVSRRAIAALLARRITNTSIFFELLWSGFPQTTVYYERVERKTGRSKWTLRKKVKLFVDTFISFSDLPVRVMSASGVLCAALAVGLAALLVARAALGGPPLAGWGVVLVAVLLLGGAQMLLLGILGEYVWRTLWDARQRPPYVVQEIVGAPPPSSTSAPGTEGR
jgi:dolichol-phosphate mannosyltransferase